MIFFLFLFFSFCLACEEPSVVATLKQSDFASSCIAVLPSLDLRDAVSVVRVFDASATEFGIEILSSTGVSARVEEQTDFSGLVLELAVKDDTVSPASRVKLTLFSSLLALASVFAADCDKNVVVRATFPCESSDNCQYAVDLDNMCRQQAEKTSSSFSTTFESDRSTTTTTMSSLTTEQPAITTTTAPPITQTTKSKQTFVQTTTATPEPLPKGYALIDVTATTQKPTKAVLGKDKPFVSIVSLSQDIVIGDVFRIRGVIEYTCDDNIARGHIRIHAQGALCSNTHSENIQQTSTHHMPLYADCFYDTSSLSTSAVKFDLMARSTAATMKIENQGYTGMFVEHFRRFSDLKSGDKPLQLQSVTIGSPTGATKVGINAPSKFVEVNAVVSPASSSSSSTASDIVVIESLTTAQYIAQTRVTSGCKCDMHGSSIRKDSTSGAKISRWATQNTPFDVNKTPMWTVARDQPRADTAQRYLSAMHGINGAGAGVGTSQLIAARFGASQRGLSLVAGTVQRQASVTSVKVNGGWTVIGQVQSSSLVKKGGFVRATVMVGLQYPSASAYASQLGIACSLRLSLSGGSPSASAVSSKYITKTQGVMSLRSVLFAEISNEAKPTVQAMLSCARSGAPSSLKLALLSGSYFNLIVEAFDD